MLTAAAAPPQSNIETTGYRSLQQGEEVEFDLVIGDDGKRKAFRVTGPQGAPPQVRLGRQAQGAVPRSCRAAACTCMRLHAA